MKSTRNAILSIAAIVAVMFPATGLSQHATIFSAGGGHTIALNIDGVLYGWGSNNDLQITGEFLHNSRIDTPTQVGMDGVLTGKTITAIAAGGNHTLYLASDGTLYARGSDYYGQLGDVAVHEWGESEAVVAVDMSGALSGKTITSIAAGVNHSLALADDGSLFAWGGNSVGQLGDGSNIDRATPVAVATGAGYVYNIAAGGHQTMALNSSYEVWTWGSNSIGQLGDGTTTDSNVPVQVDLTGVSMTVSDFNWVEEISVGSGHMLVRSIGGGLAAWGSNGSGELGIGSTTSSSTPVLVDMSGALTDLAATNIATGVGTSLIQASDGNLYAWGDGEFGQTGNGLGTSSTVPVAVDMSGALAGKTITDIDMGMFVGHALASDGSIYSWGYNINRQVGNGITDIFDSPVPIVFFTGWDPPEPASGPTPANNATNVPLDQVLSWVANDADDTDGYKINIQADHLQGIVVEFLDIGDITSYTPSLAYGTQYAWHVSPYNIVGEPNLWETDFWYFTTEDVPLLDAPLTSGNAHSVVRDTDGALFAWGDNPYGQLGDGTTTQSNAPVAVDMSGVLAGKTISAVEAGTHFTAALTTDGGLYAWGNNTNGELGNGSNTDSHTPVAVDMTGALAGKSIVSVSVGSTHALVLSSDGEIFTWGYNGEGQLGNGTTTSSNVPVAVDMSGALSGLEIVDIAAAATHNLVLSNTGEVFTWGNNLFGQLGNNSTTQSLTPIKVGTNSSADLLDGRAVTRISASYAHNLVLTSDGTLYGWGSNLYGDLGIGNNINQLIPVAVDMSGVLAGKKVKDFEAGYLNNLLLTTDGGLYSWGDNTYGQLGNGTTLASNLPVAVDMTGVLAGKTISEITAGSFHQSVMDSDGNVYTWGASVVGQLGNGTNTNSSVPVSVNAFVTAPLAATSPSPANGATSVALDADFSWTAADGASGYRLSFGTDNPPSNVVNNSDLGNTTSYAPETLSYATTYYWSITPYNSAGDAGDVQVWSFATLGAPPSLASNPSPQHEAVGVSLDTDLSWSAATGATGYKLSLGTDNPPTNLVNASDLGNETTYSPVSLANGTTYYWSITPYNGTGDASGVQVWSFTTSPALPGLATTPSPANAATGVALDAALSWAAATGATGYKLSVGTDNPPTNLVNASDLGDALTSSPGTLAYSTTYYWSVTPYNSAGDATDVQVWTFTTMAEPTPDVTLSMNLTNNRTNIPAAGGKIRYSLSFENTTNESQTFRLKIAARHESGQTYGPLGPSPVNITLAANGTRTENLVQNIQSSLPAGAYVFYALIGHLENTRMDSAGIELTKDASVALIENHQDEPIQITDSYGFYEPSGIQALANDRWTGEGIFRADGTPVLSPTGVVLINDVLPEQFGLTQNYPNPFNPATTISFDLVDPATVSLKVYDMQGGEVAQLASGHYESGRYSVSFTPQNLSSGTYLYVLEAGSFREVKRMLYLK